ncbi:MAG: N-6 DNA methylase [Bernardetiaceae bacterium]|nr:N-6 DNA methylase [Bernardetiaceae bacterium]
MKKNLFGEVEVLSLSIDKAASVAKVSTATIRNWIKTGYLKQAEKGDIELNSFNQFMENIAGKDKLIQRANKLMKDEHDHDALSELIKSKIHSKNWATISKAYENSLSNAYRNKEGIYYTPIDIIEDMFEGIYINHNTKFLDPCCGSGNFIIQAIKKGVKPEHVYGFDIDANAVEITKKRIQEETGYDASENIKKLDFLESALRMSKERQYDLIFTNPPWGKKLKKREKEKYAALYGAGSSNDTTSLFYFASFQLLKAQGTLGFLVQEALFNISSFRDARKHILNQKLLRLIDYGKPFKGLLTKAFAFVLKKENAKNLSVLCQYRDIVHKKNQSAFDKNPKSILNFWTKKEDSQIINFIYEQPHTTLQEKAKWGLGIVTGNNVKYCVQSPKEGYVPIFKGTDIAPNSLKPPSNYIPRDFSNYQQVAPISLYQAKSKLIYRFISSKLVFFCDTEQRFILNSANFLIPNPSLGISNQQLADLLNSNFMNWLFTALFNTHKVLRGDLEQLPIHTAYFKEQNKFTEESFLDYLGLKASNHEQAIRYAAKRK